MEQARKYEAIQCGRGLAALSVVLFHANGVLSLPKYLGEQAAPVFNAGDSGVHFFFVLSGLIMVLAHWSERGNRQVPGLFLWKRFRRIYPILWVMLVGVMLGLIFLPQLAPHGLPKLSEIALAFAVLPQAREPLLAVEWTLKHEIIFYLIFALVLWRQKLGFSILAIWLACGVVGGLLRLDFPLRFWLSPFNLLFAFGMVAGLVIKYLKPGRPGVLFGLGIVLFASGWVWVAGLGNPSDRLPAILLFGVGAALILVGSTVLENSGRLRLPRSLRFLGDASYSIYLFHFPALSVLAKVVMALKAEGVTLPSLAWYGLIVVFATSGGALMYVLLERPILALLPVRISLGRRAAAEPSTAREG